MGGSVLITLLSNSKKMVTAEKFYVWAVGLFIVFSPLAFGNSEDLPRLSERAVPKQSYQAEIADLVPLASGVGELALLKEKHHIAEYRSVGGNNLDAFLLRWPAEVVVGPGPVYYIIKNLELAVAAAQAEISVLPVKVAFNFHDLSKPQFEHVMRMHGWAVIPKKNEPPLPRKIHALSGTLYHEIARRLADRQGQSNAQIEYWAALLRREKPEWESKRPSKEPLNGDLHEVDRHAKYIDERRHEAESFLRRMVDLGKLHPLQPSIGKMNKDSKIAKIEKKGRKYLYKRDLEVIVGPDLKHPGEKRYYLLDGNNKSVAAWELGIDELNGIVLDDLSDLSSDNFFAILKERGWIYLWKHGQPITPEELPSHLKNLQDDVFRDLAEAVQSEDDIEQHEAHFQTCYWADFFGEKMHEVSILWPVLDAEVREKLWPDIVEQARFIARQYQDSPLLLPGALKPKHFGCAPALKAIFERRLREDLSGLRSPTREEVFLPGFNP